MARSRGVYRDEVVAFGALGVPPPREIPFDLIAQATLMLLPLLLGISLAMANLGRLVNEFQMDHLGGVSPSSPRLAWLCLVVPIGRLAHLLGHLARRVADAKGDEPRPTASRRIELGARNRRLAAFVIDTSSASLAACALPTRQLVRGRPASRRPCGCSSAVPLGFAAVTIPFMLREGEHAGQSLGKQLCRPARRLRQPRPRQPAAAPPRANCS